MGIMQNSQASVAEQPVDRGGRPASTSAHELAAHAQRLFLANGFDTTSAGEIAEAAGVSRRTFFRYFSTKADVVWVESDAELAAFRRRLDESGPSVAPEVAVTEAFIASLVHDRTEDEWARHRAQLILTEPAVQAKASEVYRLWRSAIFEHLTERRGLDEVYATAVAHAALAASTATHERWLAGTEFDLAHGLRRMFSLMVPALPG
ncbi:acyl-CoA-like ligand-binding transcription factor [Gordonia soli]|uniref:Putative TetR family transcriptional regulator n=1 Tax=Gordonia soli NBRC 108243 TaxID=1223545 RepID=M0QNT1_9ACTN|nr:TetR family transcriptional regulator [Gordonia soli]GAC69092.1 putative TetR family transcriptional regulator [Gordonia soli NBRC 108243]